MNDPSRLEMLLLWVLFAAAALTGLCARLAHRMFNISELMPSDGEQARQWRVKRRWMMFSEVAALPAFATAWVAAAVQWTLPIPLVVLGSMASGALGFGFLIHALQVWVMRKAAQ